MTSATDSKWYLFSGFAFSLSTGELRRDGLPVEVQQQPARVLAHLIARRGALVARQELKELIWGDATFVDFDRSLNYCIRHLRRILGESARNPRFIQTHPRRGYRFIAPVQIAAAPREKRLSIRRNHRLVIAVLLGLVLGILVAHQLYPSRIHLEVIQIVHALTGETPPNCAF